MQLHEVLTNWVFWVATIITVRVVSGRYVEMQRIRAQERHWRREQDAAAEKRLMGLSEDQDVAGLKLRVEALEVEVAELQGRRIGRRQVSRSGEVMSEVEIIDQTQ